MNTRQNTLSNKPVSSTKKLHQAAFSATNSSQAPFRGDLNNHNGITASDIMQLQKALGNQAAGQLLQAHTPPVQRQLEIAKAPHNGTFYSAAELPPKLQIPKKYSGIRDKIIELLGKWANDPVNIKSYDNWILAVEAAASNIASGSGGTGGTSVDERKESRPEGEEFEIALSEEESVVFSLNEYGRLSSSEKAKFSAVGLQHTERGHSPDYSREALINMALTNKKGSGKWISHKTMLQAADAAYLLFWENRDTKFQEFYIPSAWCEGYRYMKITEQNRKLCLLEDKNKKGYGVFAVEVDKACVAFTKGGKIKTVFPFAEESVPIGL